MDRARSRPNIIYVTCHDLGRYLGCYGVTVETPNIDRIAEEGVRFDGAFCTAPQCSPSRSSVLTGLSPHANGMMGLAHLGWELRPDIRKLPQYLCDLGYQTCLFGTQHESADASSLGYDLVHDCTEMACRATDSAIQWLEHRAFGEDPRPFYMCLGFHEPHRPYPVDSFEYTIGNPATMEIPPYLPDRPGIRSDLAGLDGLVRHVDQCIGRLLDTLDHTRLGSDTLVIFSTDHGIAMPRAKGTCYDPGIGIALLMRLPGRIEAGTSYSGLLSNLDLLPTLVEIASGDPPTEIEGRSFLPLLDGGEYIPRDHVFSEITWHDRYIPTRSVRTTHYKYIRSFGRLPLVFIPIEVYESPAGREMRDEYYSSIRPAEELYDLSQDPHEKNNLADCSEYFSVKTELIDTLEDWMRSTHDPILEGFVRPTEQQWQREVRDAMTGRYQKFEV